MLVVLSTLLMSGCSVGVGGPGLPLPPDYPSVYRSSHPDIPPGHMPPPGKCRIWYPDRPPGHQPPPGDCYY
ncbi:MAG: hypothetical protein C4576_30190 [Desulfobacteraceae bacterium]|nr:MAG: hypothetical protein C4576_30190 [Desulfobacteraceae bacterium]